MKFIRLDEDHFAYLVGDDHLSSERVHEWRVMFEEFWPGKRLMVFRADEFVDLTGRYEIVERSDLDITPREAIIPAAG